MKNVNSLSPLGSISFSFDIGHSSIGWAAFEKYDLKGCGSVFFGETCQNQKRAELRRQRRHVAATRNRVRRLRTLLLEKGVLTPAQFDEVHTSAPWHDAARVLAGEATLNWKQLWNVVRWYAHNRGYDGNEKWARGDESETQEDTEKVQKAHELMRIHKTDTMAATVCAALNCAGARKDKRSSNIYFKGYGAAFERAVVEKEIRTIFEKHKGKLKGIDDALIAGLFDDWKKAGSQKLKLPARFQGGILFGQFVPRFDNRIIPACRITGKNTPGKHSPAYYEFRWMQTLGNVVVFEKTSGGKRPLTVGEIKKLDARMRELGRMTGGEFKKAVSEITGADTRQLDNFFMTAEMEEGLVLDPAVATIRKYPHLSAVREKLSEPHRRIWQKRLFGEKRNAAGKLESLADWLAWLAAHGVATEPLKDAVRATLEAPAKNSRASSKKKGTAPEETFESLSEKPVKLEFKASGRAPYCSEILEKAAGEYRAGKNPKRAPDEAGKDAGAIYETEEVIRKLAARPLAALTNNHLIRHRLVILEKLLGKLVKNFAGNDPKKVGSVVVEVIRDLKEFSGLNDKEKAQLLAQKLGHHRSVSQRLEIALKALGRGGEVSAGLIRKARIADDQGWRCPYTGSEFGLQELLDDGMMDLDHVIPRSMRSSDSLDSLVVTYSEVNRLKGKRTAWQFINEETGNAVNVGGARGNKTIMTPAQFKEFVDRKMPRCPKGGWDDDAKRCRRRKALLLATSYDEGESEFLPKALTQTSHLNKLAAARITLFFRQRAAAPKVVHLPGNATATVRKSWKLMGCLEKVVPETKEKTKTDIRGITHLHHAVDAATLGWISTFLNRGTGNKLWEILLKKRIVNEADKKVLRENGNFSIAADGSWQLKDLPEGLKGELIACLEKCDVSQHLPASRRGLKVEETVWGVTGEDKKNPEKVVIHQNVRTVDLSGGTPVVTLKKKEDSIKPGKLLGFRDRQHHGKLGAQKGVRVIAENYGVALDPQPEVLPYYKVHPKLAELAEKNGGKWPRVLRNGMVIEVKSGSRKGTWRITSVKDTEAYGIALDLAEVGKVRLAKGNAPVAKLIQDGLEIL